MPLSGIHASSGIIRDRSFENQSYRASSLTLITATITLCNTVCIENAINQLKLPINNQLLSHLSPLGREHINLTGEYIWRTNKNC
ncbi:Tn3 family transposase [Salmonella enterica]|nr:hypothetical protein [Salmonella enterica]EDN6746545.1 transposase [Salmonella enterica]ELI0025928.1 Tn3 family transposase [Salmonella enterica]ELI0151725.1 Tn3 family transposase [Salmonella enterica]